MTLRSLWTTILAASNANILLSHIGGHHGLAFCSKERKVTSADGRVVGPALERFERCTVNKLGVLSG